MAISKIILNGVTQMDVTQDTVTASSMALDVTAHGADGELVTGNIASKSSSDLTASGATVTAPAGLYTADATKTVASGTEGTPSATKGTVSNHSISVTPSVTNSAGYISGGTHTGTAVTVSASELVSGSETKTENGTFDVTNLAELVVNVSSAPTYTATITGNTNSKVTYNGVDYSGGSTFEFYEDDIASITVRGSMGCYVYVDGIQVSSGMTPLVYNYTLPGYDVHIDLSHSAYAYVTFNTISITSNGTYDMEDYIRAEVNVPSSAPNLQSKTNINPTTSSQTISADSGYDGLSSVQINAMPSGTAGTPSATKGTVSNHSISVTPSVTNTTGYITGGTKTGTAVTVSASELVSGTYTVDSSGTKDVTNYASASVSAGTAGTPSATKGTVSNHQVSVTPSVTNTTGWITGGTKSGTAVTVTASELASGNKAIVDNGTNIDVVGYSTVSVAVPFSSIYSGSGTPSSSTGVNGDIYLKLS